MLLCFYISLADWMLTAGSHLSSAVLPVHISLYSLIRMICLIETCSIKEAIWNQKINRYSQKGIGDAFLSGYSCTLLWRHLPWSLPESWYFRWQWQSCIQDGSCFYTWRIWYSLFWLPHLPDKERCYIRYGENHGNYSSVRRICILTGCTTFRLGEEKREKKFQLYNLICIVCVADNHN